MNISTKEILNSVKSYSVLIVPLIISLAAVIIFMISGVIGSRLQNDIRKKSIRKINTLKSLQQDIISPKQWEIERDYQEALCVDANKVAAFFSNSTKRNLLDNEIFPVPKELSKLYFANFGQLFAKSIDNRLRVLRVSQCPSDLELGLEKKSQSDSSSSVRSRRFRPKTRTKSTKKRITEKSKQGDIEETIRNVVCLEKAANGKVYIDANDIAGYGFWIGTQDRSSGGPINRNVNTKNARYDYVGKDDIIICWQTQLAYWVAEDVIDTIKAINLSSENIFGSPVKRLISISFNSEKARGDPLPKYALDFADWLTDSHTDRLTKDGVDVIHFNVTVIVDSKSVTDFMQELSRAKEHVFNGWKGRLPDEHLKHNSITILTFDVRAINRQSSEHEYYRYGENSIVELELNCEYIFDSNSYSSAMPEQVKELFSEGEEEYNDDFTEDEY